MKRSVITKLECMAAVLAMVAAICFSLPFMAGCTAGGSTDLPDDPIDNPGDDPYADFDWDAYEEFLNTVDWSSYDISDESVAFYNAEIYSRITYMDMESWFREDFIYDEDSLISTTYLNPDYAEEESSAEDEYISYSGYPDTRTWTITDRDTMESIFTEEKTEELGVDFDSQMVVVYFYESMSRTGYYIKSIEPTEGAEGTGTDSITITARVKHANPLMDASYAPRVAAIVTVLDNPGVSSAQFVVASANDGTTWPKMA